MQVLSRSAITVTHKKPFIDWNNEIFPELPIEDMIGESTTFLIDELFNDAEKVVQKNFKKIFEFELEGTCTDEEKWPKKRTFKLFNEWFTVEVSGWVVDLSKKDMVSDW